MIPVVGCLVGVFLILRLNEYLIKQKLVTDEISRKFVHITVGSFVAFWPWLVNWQTISFLGLLMLVVVLINRSTRYFRFNFTGRHTYGDVFFALAIIVCSLITSTKIFFAVAMLHLSLADGLAAIVGSYYTKGWRYNIFGQTKTIIGSMTFWLTSLCILGVGLLPAHNLIDFNHYVILLIVLPPILTAIENISVFGLDNLLIPFVVIFVLQLA